MRKRGSGDRVATKPTKKGKAHKTPSGFKLWEVAGASGDCDQAVQGNFRPEFLEWKCPNPQKDGPGHSDVRPRSFERGLPNPPLHTLEYGSTPFWKACQEGNPKSAQFLASKGADIEARNMVSRGAGVGGVGVGGVCYGWG